MPAPSRRPRPRGLTQTLLQHRFLLINIAGSMVIAVFLAGWIVNRFRNNDAERDQRPSEIKRNAESDPPAAGEKKHKAGLCRVYTKEAGFYVFINGEPARDRNDEWLATPCAVTLPRGGQEITVAKAGYRDRSKYVDVADDSEVVFESHERAGEGETGLLEAAYLRTKTDEPISLFHICTPQRELDPFITPDGLTLYFASDRSPDGLRAVYEVSRKTSYSYFSGQAKPVVGTRGPRMPASPSLTSNSLSLVYTLPDLGIIKCVSRPSPVSDFAVKRDLDLRKPSSSAWLSAQIVREGDRDWRFYGLLRERGRLRGYTALAKQTEERNNAFGAGQTESLLPLADRRQEFRKLREFDLRETPPCLSRDGRRQYFFDGKFLKRATRTNLDAPFGEPQLMASFSRINDYAPAANRRSFTISDDEQWLIYESRGDLHMVRVFNRPRPELAIVGRSIPPRVVKVAKVPQEVATPKVKVEKQSPVDLRTLPLPYPAFRKTLVALLKARKYPEANKHVAAGLKDPALAKDRELVRWDADDATNTAAFWSDFAVAAARMKPGEEFLAGPVRLTFVRYEKGELVATVNGQTVRKTARLLKLSDAVRIVDKHLGRDDETVTTHLATFWFYDAQGGAASAFGRFRRAPKAGAQFRERLARRQLQQAQHEFARGNVAAALEIVNVLRKSHPDSQAAKTGQTLVDKAYAAVTWQEVGPRQWKKENGAYTAAADGRKEAALLRSPKQYENFELRLEWKSDSPNGQGGVYFRYSGVGNPVETAFKIQLADDFGVPADRLCTGSLFKVQGPTTNAVNPRGQWNELRLRVQGESVQAVINGQTVLETKAVSTTIPRKGFVALDGVLGGITYRKTLLLELPAKTPSR